MAKARVMKGEYGGKICIGKTLSEGYELYEVGGDDKLIYRMTGEFAYVMSEEQTGDYIGNVSTKLFEKATGVKLPTGQLFEVVKLKVKPVRRLLESGLMASSYGENVDVTDEDYIDESFCSSEGARFFDRRLRGRYNIPIIVEFEIGDRVPVKRERR